MSKKPFEPQLRTPLEEQSKEEHNKRNSDGMRGTLGADIRDGERQDIAWESEQLAKSYGIYLEFNRAKTGKEKDWFYMIRLGIPGGGPITPQQWAVIDAIGSEYGANPEGYGSIRLTTRENVQFHWIKKEHVVPLIQRSAEQGLLSLNGCGDNVRNVMACPFSRNSPDFDAHAWAAKVADYFQLPAQPFIQIFAIDPNQIREDNAAEAAAVKGKTRFEYGPGLLNRKFKIAFGAVHRNADGILENDNCTELRTHDMGVSPVIENNQVSGFQIYIGGGQGEKNGKPSGAMLGKPVGVVNEENLLAAMDAVVQVHQTWGDRANRHWARLKYVVKKQGIDWYRDRMHEILDFELGAPIEDHDVGARELHHGWQVDPITGLDAYCAFIENGRLIDNSPNGRLKTMAREVALKFDTPLFITPNQDLVFSGIAREQRAAFEAALAEYGYGQRNGVAYSTLRKNSGACVGRSTCRLAYTESEQFEPELIDALEGLGWADYDSSIGITGCERQCFRPATKAIGLVGSGNNRYQFKLLGTEDGRHQGQPVIDNDLVYLKSVPRDQVAVLINVLYSWHRAEGEDGETFGYFIRRKGLSAVVAYLKEREETAALLAKPLKNLTALV
ncbi:hypothetical protein [Acanthopleuribacter pedis]|uniref:Uncharacterized protein n=1 Tax=Acanthopleuribacter pedis TaxID=442870 RepID=A0A8J7QBW0_9BACT|nr:hypothetical protein [Acanthopleuribacter pedis]MBO1318131.1 hypothetical protein [Acanthopleuribacter pedis]